MPKPLIMSASQFTTFDSCNRKWWMQRVARLQEVPRQPDPFTFGDVLHAVLERYLEADELGRGPDGKPVDLYPEGWKRVVKRFGADKGQVREVTDTEAALIQRLVSTGIEQGIIERLPGRKIEDKVYRKVLDAPACLRCDAFGCEECGGKGYDSNVFLMGFIDMALRAEVHDHKSSKSTRWLLGPKRLSNDPQMLTYAAELVLRAMEKGEPPPETITLRHNQFVKDPDAPVVRKTITTVSRQKAESFWHSRIVPAAQQMLRVRRITEWHEVDGPAENSNACNAYGGCPYQSICSGQESIERYQARVKRRLEKIEKEASTCQGPDVDSGDVQETQRKAESKMAMSIKEKLAAKKAKQQAATAAPPPKPAPEPVSEGSPPTTPASVEEDDNGDLPPWAQPTCKACSGIGFASNGLPCRICDIKSKKTGTESARYTISTDDGVTYWADKDGTVIGGRMVGEQPEAQVKEELPPAPAPEPKPTPAPEPTPKPTRKKVGRPAKGFTLLINCVTIKGRGKLGSGAGVIFLTDVIAGLHAQMVTEAGVDSPYDLDTFKRREALCRCAPRLVEEFGTDNVVANTDTPDERELARVLQAMASTVIVGTR